MHKYITQINRCVKNVNNQRIIGSLNSVHSSTNLVNQLSLCNYNGAQTQLLNNYIQQPSTTFYTTLSSKFNLLSKTFTHNPQALLMSLIKEN